MDVQFTTITDTVSISVETSGAGYRVMLNGQTYQIESAQLKDGALAFTLNGQRHIAYAAREGQRRWVAQAGQIVTLTVPEKKKARRGQRSNAAHDSLEAQLPGVIRKVLVTVGDTVERGQALLVLEAMKMEMKIAAPHDGVVEKIAVGEGETVQKGQLLVEVVET